MRSASTRVGLQPDAEQGVEGSRQHAWSARAVAAAREGLAGPAVDRLDRPRAVEVVGEGGADVVDGLVGDRTTIARQCLSPGLETLLGVDELPVVPDPVLAVVPGEQSEPDRHRVDALAAQL